MMTGKIYIFLAAIVFLLVTGLAVARADESISSQISDAIAKGDYKTAQQLVTQNPDQADAAELKLLGSAEKAVPSNPQNASLLLTLSSNLSPYIDDKDAAKVAADVKTLTDNILKSSGADGGAPDQGFNPDTTVSLLNSALTVAQSKAVAANDPSLAPQIQSELEQYADANDVLLAQIPNRNFFKIGDDQRFYQPLFNPPATTGGSPF